MVLLTYLLYFDSLKMQGNATNDNTRFKWNTHKIGSTATETGGGNGYLNNSLSPFFPEDKKNIPSGSVCEVMFPKKYRLEPALFVNKLEVPSKIVRKEVNLT